VRGQAEENLPMAATPVLSPRSPLTAYRLPLTAYRLPPYLMASGFTGEPTAPVIGSAGATNRNS
jgi:hypothetical protein